MGRVVVVGPLQLTLVADVDRLPGPGTTATAHRTRRAVGGRGVDQARAARRAGADVVMVGAVGDDDAGRWCAGALFDAGIETRLAVVGHQPTGLALTATDRTGSSSTIEIPGANGAVEELSAGLADLGPSDLVLVHLGLGTEPVTAAVRIASAAHARVVVDASPFTTVPTEAAGLADPLVVGERDAMMLADSGTIPASLCVSFGTAGAVWDGLRIDGTGFGSVPDSPAALGADDGFCGRLAAALVAGADRPSALRLAIAS